MIAIYLTMFLSTIPLNGELQWLAPGQLIRFEHAAGGDAEEVRVRAVSANRVLLAYEATGETFEMAQTDMRSLEIGRERGTFGKQGMMLGMATGAFVGLTAGDGDPRHPAYGAARMLSFLLGAGLGAVVGGGIGSGFDHVEWTPILAPDVEQPGAIEIGLHFDY